MNVIVDDFGSLKNGEVKKFILQNDNMKVVLTNYGATLVSVFTKDREGKVDDILLGFDDLEGYCANRYFGSTIGRCANRIGCGKFQLDCKTYQLDCNNNGNHLHGGKNGFNMKVWSWSLLSNGVKFSLESEDMDGGYPGNLSVSSTYELTQSDQLKMTMRASVKDKPTIVNLTNHAFINLSGQKCNEDILNHSLEIKSSKYLQCNRMIPTGEFIDVDNTFDFRSEKLIGDNIPADGYDHNYCLDNTNVYAARVYHSRSGRVLEIKTNQPGIQFYTGNFLDTIGKNGKSYKQRDGFCLEPQNYPDAINHDNFPSPILRVGEEYENWITWTFSLR